MKYTKENFKKGLFCFINDESKELEDIINEWFPDNEYYRKSYKYIAFLAGKWIGMDNKQNTPIHAKDITEPKEWLGREMEHWNGKYWISCTGLKYRLKQYPNHTDEILRLAKEMNVNVIIENQR